MNKEPNMSLTSLPPDIRNLDVVERIELATAIWDSVAEEGKALVLSEAQKAALDERLASRERSPDAGDTWENVRRRITGQR